MFDENEAREALQEEKFQPLLAQFNPEEVPTKAGSYRPLASDTTFNPFGDLSEKLARQREFAWYAAHETDRFVREMSKRVRQIINDPTLTALVRELNMRAKVTPIV